MTLRVKHLTEDPKKRGDVEYDPIDIGFLRDEEDPMVAWVARATTERGEYELDEEADDPEDPPRPNTFLARAVAEATAEEEGDRGMWDNHIPLVMRWIQRLRWIFLRTYK